LAGGVDASYAVAAGKTTILISSKDRLKHKAVYVGTGQMTFHWVQEGKTQAWRCDISMVDSVAAQVAETTGTDGSQQLEVELGDVYPAGCLLQKRMVGTLVAPAVHVDVPFGSDVWVFLIRSPWFPLKLQIDRPILTVEHDTSRVTASLNILGDGSLSAQVAVDGTKFENASLVVKRALGSYSSDEAVGEVGTGTQAFAWKPIMRVFDLVLVTKGSISESNLADIARGLGAQISSGVFGAGDVEGDFILCDGPATSYIWTLKGHRGFLENVEDQTASRFTW
jgi:hypothetical protein